MPWPCWTLVTISTGRESFCPCSAWTSEEYSDGNRHGTHSAQDGCGLASRRAEARIGPTNRPATAPLVARVFAAALPQLLPRRLGLAWLGGPGSAVRRNPE